MKPINLIPILLLSLIFFGFDDPCAVDSPQLTHNCRGVRPDAPTGNPSTPNFYYHPWLEHPYHTEMQGPLPPNQGTDDYEIIFNAIGPNENSMLGKWLCLAGHQNGDLNDDILAYCEEDPRETRLYLGSEIMDTIPDMVFPIEHGTGAWDWSGIMPIELQDLNGDGDVDIVIESEIDYYNREVYIYYGGALLDDEADLVLVCDDGSISGGEGFGYYMSCGDVNGDGYCDLAIGAHGYTILSAGSGKVFVYFGGSNFDSIPDFTITSGYNNLGGLFGGSISISGDVNNDGYNDIVSIWSKTSQNSTGIYLFYGDECLDSIPDWTYQLYYGPGQYNIYSSQIIKDLNNDGYDEIVIFTSHGYGYETHLFFGGETIGNTPDLIIQGGLYITNKIKTAGDINADGYNDMIMGNYENNWVKVYYGGDPMNAIVDITFYLPDAGHDVGFAGDVNGDGIHDFMFYALDDAGTGAGQFFIYSDPSLTPYAEPKNGDNSPISFNLDQNFPNPFNSFTIIPFQVNQEGKYELNIYNILGQDIYSRVFECSAGENVRILWDGRDRYNNPLSSGIYLVELSNGRERETRMMEILR